MKRIVALVISFALLLAALPATQVSAAGPYSGPGAVIHAAEQGYAAALEASGNESFEGLCGMLSSYLLWHMGINSWVIGKDGNQQFDYYKDMSVTSGGYYVSTYSAEYYSLLDALNLLTRNGSRDAYNILVCFEKTNTEQGQLYGHSLVIYAIIDGTVYYMENLPKDYAGSILTSSVEEFVWSYEGWTEFEGVVHFGNGEYVDTCQLYGTDMFVRARYDTTLRSQPCVVGKNECTLLRTVAGGELLRANLLCKDPWGQMFYRITDGDFEGYIAADAVTVTRFNGEGVSALNVEFPTYKTVSEDPDLTGKITAPDGAISGVEVKVVNAGGVVAYRHYQDATGYTLDLSTLNEALMLDILEEGLYRLEIYGTAVCRWVKGQTVKTDNATARIYVQTLQVGGKKPEEMLTITEDTEQEEAKPMVLVPEADYTGWLFANQSWYFFRDGLPATGWTEDLGISYYLQADGSVTTGYAEVEGEKRYFSATGALCNGWMSTRKGMLYLQEGLPVIGWQEIKGSMYYFQENGIMQTRGTQKIDDITYTFRSDGKATIKE